MRQSSSCSPSEHRIFTNRVGTVFNGSNVSLTLWATADVATAAIAAVAALADAAGAARAAAQGSVDSVKPIPVFIITF